MITSTPEEIYEMAVRDFSSGDVRRALKKFNDLQVRQAKDLGGQPIQYWIGVCHVALEEFESAITPLESALREAPSDCHPYFAFRLRFCLGSSYYYTGEPELARKYFENADEFVDQVPDAAESDLFEFHFRFGRTYFDLKLYSKALVESEKAREVLPYSTDLENGGQRDLALVCFDIGQTYYFLGRNQEAIDILSEIKQAGTGDRYHLLRHLYIGRALKARENYLEALTAFKQCESDVNQLDGPADLYFDIGQCLYMTNQLSEATMYLKKALLMKTTTDWVQDSARELLKELEKKFH